MPEIPSVSPQKINAKIGVRFFSSAIDAGVLVPFGILYGIGQNFNVGGMMSLVVGGLGYYGILLAEL